jgi:hypothetical protein
VRPEVHTGGDTNSHQRTSTGGVDAGARAGTRITGGRAADHASFVRAVDGRAGDANGDRTRSKRCGG